MIHQKPATTGEGPSAAIERASSPQILTTFKSGDEREARPMELGGTLVNKLQDKDDEEGAGSLPCSTPELQSHVDADSQAGDEALVSDAKQIIGTFVTVA